MRQRILNLIYASNYKKKSYIEIKEILNITQDDEEVFSKAFDDLKNEGEIISKNGLYDKLERLGYMKGHLTFKPSGYAYVLDPSDDLDAVAIEPNNLNNSYPRDYVIIEVDPQDYDFERKMRYGIVKRVIKREGLSLVGYINYKKKSNQYFLDIQDEKMRYIECIVDASSIGGVTDELVKVEVIKFLGKNKVIAKITEILGHDTDPGIDILTIVCKNNVPHIFEQAVLNEVEDVPTEVTEQELIGRRSILDEIVITIDGEDAKDLDDAISISKQDNVYNLKVHIADVSHYVLEGTYIDKEAFNRSTSVYLADRVIPMLPRKLSNGICSLNENVLRLTITCEMNFDLNGNLISHDIYESYIKTLYRMTYTNINKMINADEEISSKYKELIEMVSTMVELSDILRNKRTSRGGVDFETSECKFKFDEKGNVIDVIPRLRDKAEMLIEDFMLAANETVAEHLTNLNMPCLYRIHEAPDSKKLDKAIGVIRTLGGKTKGAKGGIHPKELQKVLQSFEGKAEAKVVNTLMLRSMAKAKYSPHNVGHYGLAAEKYCHFTSPIRRYPDTIIHRMLKDFLFRNKDTEKEVDKYNSLLDYIGMQTSKMERLAIETEREVEDMKKAEYMSNFIGEKYEGVISSVTSFGVFIELENTVEGLVHVSEMFDDFYDFDEKMMCMVGRRSKKNYKIGDKVLIKVTRASKEEGRIDFCILKKL